MSAGKNHGQPSNWLFRRRDSKDNCCGSQIVEVIDPMARQDRLDALLKKYHASRKNRVLVFVLYKKEASRIESFLQRRGWKVCPIAAPLQHQLRYRNLRMD